MKSKTKASANDGHFDIRNRLAYRISTLASTNSLWASRAYLDECGVTMIEWRVLATLASVGPRTARQICSATKMDKGNVSRAVKKLLRDGRIVERPDPSDRRAAILSVTAKGRATYRKVKRYSDEREERLLSVLGNEDHRKFVELVEKLQAESETMIREMDFKK